MVFIIFAMCNGKRLKSYICSTTVVNSGFASVSFQFKEIIVCMSLLLNRKIRGDVQIGVWKIEETPAQLLKMLHLTPMEEKIYQTIQNEERKKQWLSYRVIIKKLLNLGKILDINYDKQGKPKILNHYLRVSVTHSGCFSAAILHKNKPTGIDIEKISPRIKRVKAKFLSQQELNEISDPEDLETLHTYWGAKEVIYKLQTLGIISLRKHIYIHPFDLQNTNVIYGEIRHENLNCLLKITVERIEDYMLVYSVDKTRECDQ